jgi:hypothetical protein
MSFTATPEKRSRSAKQPIYDSAEITPEEARRVVALADRFVAAVDDLLTG